MVFRLGGVLLVLCTLTTASPSIPLNTTSLIEITSYTFQESCEALSGLVKMFPMNTPRIEEVFFELRTPCKRTQYAVSQARKLRNSPDFDINRKTVILVNGWLSTINEPHSESLTKAYLCRGGYNVIMVNPSGFLTSDYINAAYNTDKLGQLVAVGIKNLNIPGKNIHLLGHSLGAHVMGSAARHYASITGGKIGRVTGFDPARPCFIKTPVFNRLSINDATFVDIIHSNPTETGIEEAIGHADFYPGGLTPAKPGCLPIDVFCSHGMSVHYYTESVYPGNKNNFIGAKCNNLANLGAKKCIGPTAPMGFAAVKKSNGIYLLGVNANAPYGKNSKNDKYLKLNKCGVCTK